MASSGGMVHVLSPIDTMLVALYPAMSLATGASMASAEQALMAIKHLLTIRYYLRMLAWVFLLYVIWCFAPTLYAESRFRLEVFRTVHDAASDGKTSDQVRQALLEEADALKLPLASEDLEVSVVDSGRRMYAHYSYAATVHCLRHAVVFDFNSSSSADSVIGFKSGSPNGN
jgi:hypothetical protein